MLKVIFIGIVVGLSFMVMPGVAISGDYVLGTGDVLEISVYGQVEEGLSQAAIIRPDGKISFPLVDDVQAAGLTPKQLDDAITKKLSKRIPSPEVTVSVSTFLNSEYQVYVIGEVGGPGVFPLHGRVTLFEAVTLAGGPTRDAYLDRIHIVRKGAEKPIFITVNLKNIMYGGQKDVGIEPGDIVYIPQEFIATVNTTLDRFLPMLRVVTLGAMFGDLLD